MMKFFADNLTPERQRKLIEGLVVLNVILLILGGIFTIKLIDITSSNYRLAQDGKEAHDNLCALKSNIENRVNSVRIILRKHPKAQSIDVDPGPGVFVVSRDLLISTNQRDINTLKSLKKLSCSK